MKLEYWKIGPEIFAIPRGPYPKETIEEIIEGATLFAKEVGIDVNFVHYNQIGIDSSRFHKRCVYWTVGQTKLPEMFTELDSNNWTTWGFINH